MGLDLSMQFLKLSWWLFRF